jgi:hypothetical protein
MADYLSNANPALTNDPTSNPADDPNLAEEFEVCGSNMFLTIL